MFCYEPKLQKPKLQKLCLRWSIIQFKAQHYSSIFGTGVNLIAGS